MKYTALIFVIFTVALKAEIPAGATDLVPHTDSPAAESLKIKDEPAVTATYSEITIISPVERDVAALAKRVAALEEQVAGLKKQLAEREPTDSDNLDPETRKRSVADEVRRRRAKREAYEAKQKEKATEPNQAVEP